MSDNKYMKVEHIKQTEEKPSIVVFPCNFPKIGNLNDTNKTSWLLDENQGRTKKGDKHLHGENEKISYQGKSRTINNNLSE
jgi:hypothetical protein